MRIIIDFDRTLYDTDKAVKHTYDLVKRYGISLADWKAAWPEMFGKNYFGKGLYSIWEHIRKYKAKSKLHSRQFLQDYVKQHERHTYLFPETLDFLKSASRMGKLILITYGHKRFQKWKVEQSKIDKLFGSLHFVRVMKARGNFGRLLGKDELNVFLDDNALEIDEVKRNFPEVIAIHVRRPGTFHATRASRLKDFEVKNLRQALAIMKNMHTKLYVDEIGGAVRALKHGRAVVYPTDTVYGLGVDALNEKAVERLYKIKGRSFKQPVHIAVASRAMAEKYVVFAENARKLYDKFMPGPLTLILPLKKGASRAILKLSAGTGTLGIREPDNSTAIALVKKLHGPITATSANPTGMENPYSIREVHKLFHDRMYKPDAYLDGGPLQETKPSTVISLVDDKVKILRTGPITKNQIEKVLKQI